MDVCILAPRSMACTAVGCPGPAGTSGRHNAPAGVLPASRRFSYEVNHVVLCHGLKFNPLTQPGRRGRTARRLQGVYARQAGYAQKAGPIAPAPSYDRLDAQPLNRTIMNYFARRMTETIGETSQETGYAAILDLTRKLNRACSSPLEVQATTRRVFNTLFPAWFPGFFRAALAEQFPGLAGRLSALMTWATCAWLMGPSKINDIELEDGTVLKGQGVLVERCRFLEESGCVSVCVNTCKIPTQEFIGLDMGLATELRPNYEDFSCQFAFGRPPSAAGLQEALATPCFSQCPSRRRHASQCPELAENGVPAMAKELVRAA